MNFIQNPATKRITPIEMNPVRNLSGNPSGSMNVKRLNDCNAPKVNATTLKVISMSEIFDLVFLFRTIK